MISIFVPYNLKGNLPSSAVFFASVLTNSLKPQPNCKKKKQSKPQIIFHLKRTHLQNTVLLYSVFLGHVFSSVSIL